VRSWTEHHYLGAPSKIGQAVWYATDDRSGEWPPLAAYSAATIKCGARDAWIGMGSAGAVRAAAPDRQQRAAASSRTPTEPRMSGESEVTGRWLWISWTRIPVENPSLASRLLPGSFL